MKFPNCQACTDVDIQYLVSQTEHSLRLLDPSEVADYKEAKIKVPHLVAQGSPVIDFLLTEHCNVERAARRLAMYWKVRHEFFGDRWLLPMTQTGRGALSPSDVAILRSGFAVITNKPQAVAIYDVRRLPKEVSRIPPTILFYLSSLFAKDEDVAEHGFTLFHIQRKGRDSDKYINKEQAHKIIQGVPALVRNLIVAQAFEPGDENMLDYFSYLTVQHIEKRTGHSSQIVVGSSVRDTLHRLEERGLDVDCIPVHMGGNYFYSRQFAEWIRARLSIEDAMSAAPPAAHLVLSANSAGTRPFIATIRKRNTKLCLVPRIEGESPQEFESRRNQVYVKRRYCKRKHEVETIKKTAKYLKETNAELSVENRHLEGLLTQCQQILVQLDPTTYYANQNCTPDFVDSDFTDVSFFGKGKILAQ
jgi:hypothetical protein